jgi:dihydroorotase
MNTTLKVAGRLVNHDRDWYGTVVINTATGIIVSIDRFTSNADIVANKKNEFIFPGMGDIHIHGREDESGEQNYKEDFETVGNAAINGGIVHVCDMPNNPIAPVNDERYARKAQIATKCPVDILLYAGIGPGTKPLTRNVPYKGYLAHSVNDLFFTSQAQAEETLQHYVGMNVSYHCEDPDVIDQHKDRPTHEQRRPVQAELRALDFALHCAEKYKQRIKVCHFSAASGLPKIRQARAKGVHVTCEATHHHLYFDESMLTDNNRVWLQMNPPLRSPEERRLLIEGLRRGEVDYLASDHAPHTCEEKLRKISGVPLLDTHGSFVTWLMKQEGFTVHDIARVCSYNPGTFVNQFTSEHGRKFGEISVGFVGSLTVIDTEWPTTITTNILRTKCAWSPFEGVTFPGRVTQVVVRGKVLK